MLEYLHEDFEKEMFFLYVKSMVTCLESNRHERYTKWRIAVFVQWKYEMKQAILKLEKKAPPQKKSK